MERGDPTAPSAPCFPPRNFPCTKGHPSTPPPTPHTPFPPPHHNRRPQQSREETCSNVLLWLTGTREEGEFRSHLGSRRNRWGPRQSGRIREDPQVPGVGGEPPHGEYGKFFFLCPMSYSSGRRAVATLLPNLPGGNHPTLPPPRAGLTQQHHFQLLTSKNSLGHKNNPHQ